MWLIKHIYQLFVDFIILVRVDTVLLDIRSNENERKLLVGGGIGMKARMGGNELSMST